MKKAIISLGSNVPQANETMKQAEHALRLWFASIDFSPTISGEAIDMPPGTRPFTNQLACINTTFTPGQITALLKHLEIMLGNNKTERKHNRIVLDADLVEYNGEVLKPRDAIRPYYVALKKLL